jgi:hypothetical protein
MRVDRRQPACALHHLQEIQQAGLDGFVGTRAPFRSSRNGLVTDRRVPGACLGRRGQIGPPTPSPRGRVGCAWKRRTERRTACVHAAPGGGEIILYILKYTVFL